MKTPLIIPCRFITEETNMLVDMGISHSASAFEERNIYFYTIDLVYEVDEVHDDINRYITVISSGGKLYETTVSLYKVIDMINKLKE